jgi:hypothetical protein
MNLETFLAKDCSAGRGGWTQAELIEICIGLRISPRGNKTLLCRIIREKLQEMESESVPESVSESVQGSVPESVSESVQGSVPESVSESVQGSVPESVFSYNLTTIMKKMLLNFDTDTIYEQSKRVLETKQFIEDNEIPIKYNLKNYSEKIQKAFTSFLRAMYRLSNNIIKKGIDKIEHEEFLIYLRGFFVEEDLVDFKDGNTSEDDLGIYTPFTSSKCMNTDIIMDEEYEINDKDDVLIMYMQKSDSNKFNDDGICVSKTEIKEYLKSDLSSEYSDLLMCIWTGENLDDVGKYGKPSGRVIVKVPPYNTYITYGSFENMMKHDYNKEWYLYPLYNGNRRRIGNLAGSYGVGKNHGQIPGSKIYKAYSKKQIENGVKIMEEYSDYPIYIYENTKPLNDILNNVDNKRLVEVLLKNLL